MHDQSGPVVDVLIPAFNAESTITDSIRSIQAQSLRDIRIIVVDDGSTDATGKLLAELAREDDRIEILTRPNGGIVDALNAGLASCQASYVARHDADDIAFPNRLAVQLAYMTQHLDCVAVGGNAQHIDLAGRRLGTVSEYFGDAVSDAHQLPAKEPYLLHPFLMVRRDILMRVGGYRYVFHSEDSDLYWRLSEIGRLYGIREPLGQYRYHEGSVSSASIVNGRIQAVSSQLCATSSLRRARGATDLRFERARLAVYTQAHTFGAIVAAASVDLEPEEAETLAVAASMKLLDQSTYRPYKLDVGDYRFIGRTLRRLPRSLPGERRRELFRQQAAVAVRLIKSGEYKKLTPFAASFLTLGVANVVVQAGVKRLVKRRKN